MRMREFNHWLNLLEELGHDVDQKYVENVNGGKPFKRIIIDDKYYIDIRHSIPGVPKRIEKE